MKITIDSAVFEAFPEAKIGWVIADISAAEKSCSQINKMKRGLKGRLNNIGISIDTMMLHPDVSRWREVFSKMRVKPSKHLPSLEDVLRRVFKGELLTDSEVTNCYNSVSALNLISIGAFDREKIRGDFVLRFAKAKEKFFPCKLSEEIIDLDIKHIVYSDDEKVDCWLWDHRISRDVAISENTKQVLFTINNAFETEWRSVEQTITSLSEELEKIGCEIINSSVVNKKLPSSCI